MRVEAFGSVVKFVLRIPDFEEFPSSSLRVRRPAQKDVQVHSFPT